MDAPGRYACLLWFRKLFEFRSSFSSSSLLLRSSEVCYFRSLWFLGYAERVKKKNLQISKKKLRSSCFGRCWLTSADGRLSSTGHLYRRSVFNLSMISPPKLLMNYILSILSLFFFKLQSFWRFLKEVHNEDLLKKIRPCSMNWLFICCFRD